MKDVDDAFLELLTDAELLADVGGVPTGGGWQGAPGASQFRAYAVVHPGAGVVDGTIVDGDRQIDRDYQVTCVAASAAGAAAVADRVVAAVSGQRISTSTRTTTRPITVSRYGPLEPDDTVQPAVYMVAHMFSVDTVPADPDDT